MRNVYFVELKNNKKCLSYKPNYILPYVSLLLVSLLAHSEAQEESQRAYCE